MAVAVAVRATEHAMPAFVLVGGCPSKQSLHHKNIASPGVPNETPQALTFSDFATCSSFRIIRLSPRSGMRIAQQPIQLAGFYLAGLLCVVSAVLKLTIEGQWSWWRFCFPSGQCWVTTSYIYWSA